MELPPELLAHGEAFMAMFDGPGGHASKKAKKSQSTGPVPDAQANQPQAAAAAAGQQQSGKKKKKKKAQAADASTPSKTEPSSSQPGTPPGTPVAARKGSKRSRDDIDLILSAKHPSTKAAKQSQPSSPVPQVVHSHSAPPKAKMQLSKQERKLFMSAKAGKVHEAVASVGGRSAEDSEDSDEELHLSPQQFRSIQMEVERLGASALDKKERKKWQAAMLQRIGAQPDKAPRTPARIGKGMAAVNNVREARKLEEAMQAGMVKRKGHGKKKRLEAERNRERGLDELGRAYKAGVLKLKANPLQRGTGGRGGSARAALHPVRGLGGSRTPGSGGKKGKGKMKLPF